MAKPQTTNRPIRMTWQTLERMQGLQTKLQLTAQDVFQGVLQRGEAYLTLWHLTGSGTFDGHPEVLGDAKRLLERELQLRLDIASFAVGAARRMAASPEALEDFHEALRREGRAGHTKAEV